MSETPPGVKTWELRLGRETASFTAALSLVVGSLDELMPWRERYLAAEENRRWETLLAERRRFSLLAGRITAKLALARLRPNLVPAQVEIGEGVFGQPVVAKVAGLHVTISHADGIGGAIACPAEHPIGLDLETVRPELDRAITTGLTPAEHKLHRSLPLTASVGYAALWTIKESLAKILMCGLTTPLQVLEVATIDLSHLVLVSTFSNFAQYKALTLRRGRFVLSIALPKRTEVDLDFLRSN